MLTSAGVVWKSTIRCKFPSDYVISIKQIDYVILTKQIDYVISTKQSAWRNLRGSAHIKPFSKYVITRSRLKNNQVKDVVF